MIGKKKDDIPELNIDQANAMLSQILQECSVPENTVSLEDLISLSNYRKERYPLQRGAAIVLLVILLVLPVMFIAPDFTVKAAAGANVYNLYTVTVENALPVSEVQASMNGSSLPVEQIDTHFYAISLKQNGTMSVTVTLRNGQLLTQEIQVNDVDETPPVVTENTSDADHLYLHLADDKSGVDYEAITAATLTGSPVDILSFDQDTGLVTLEYPDESLTVTIPDYAGNKLTLMLTVK